VEAVPLDPGTYQGTYKLIGGRPALDFVNTVSWAGTSKEHDWLHTLANVGRWARSADLGDDQEADTIARQDRESTAALRRLHELRGDLRAVLAPLAHGGRPPAAAVEALDARAAASGRWRHLDPDTLTWRRLGIDRVDGLVPVLVDDAVAIVVDADHSRLGACPACDWLYYDSSRNHSKRWCDMADCGSRDKARRYYANHRP
jgi:predicted RNA-binding Zn ribbon-like protein